MTDRRRTFQRWSIGMARLDLNTFIKKHRNGFAIGYDFAQYAVIKKNNPGGEFRDHTTGMILPTPNKIIAALAKHLKGDYYLRSEKSGRVQILVMANDADVKGLLAGRALGKPNPGNGKPVKASYTIPVDVDGMGALAKKLNLI